MNWQPNWSAIGAIISIFGLFLKIFLEWPTIKDRSLPIVRKLPFIISITLMLAVFPLMLTSAFYSEIYGSQPQFAGLELGRIAIALLFTSISITSFTQYYDKRTYALYKQNRALYLSKVWLIMGIFSFLLATFVFLLAWIY